MSGRLRQVLLYKDYKTRIELECTIEQVYLGIDRQIMVHGW